MRSKVLQGSTGFLWGNGLIAQLSSMRGGTGFVCKQICQMLFGVHSISFLFFNPSVQETPIFAVHPRNPKWRFGRCFSFLKEAFSGSMLVFGGVHSDFPHLSTAKITREQTCSCAGGSWWDSWQDVSSRYLGDENQTVFGRKRTFSFTEIELLFDRESCVA